MITLVTMIILAGRKQLAPGTAGAPRERWPLTRLGSTWHQCEMVVMVVVVVVMMVVVVVMVVVVMTQESDGRQPGSTGQQCKRQVQWRSSKSWSMLKILPQIIFLSCQCKCD